MKEHEVGRWIYSILVLIAVFCVGYFLGIDQGQHPMQMTTMERSAETAHETVPAEPEPAAETEFPIDLNTASKEELMELPGIGEELAKRIEEYRNTWGRFVAKEQIMDVKGIGESKYAAIEQMITVEAQNEDSSGG